jgi:hypothetical protein
LSLNNGNQIGLQVFDIASGVGIGKLILYYIADPRKYDAFEEAAVTMTNAPTSFQKPAGWLSASFPTKTGFFTIWLF